MVEIKDLQLVGGDLFPAGRGFATVTGTDYLRQRVATALAEPYGFDPYHPDWGSALLSYLGMPIDASSTPALISSEVSRVLAQLVAAQQQQITAAALAGTRSRLGTDDVIGSVDSVSAQVSQRPDTVRVSVTLTTQGGQQVAVTRTVSS